MAEKILPLAVTRRAVEVTSGLSRPRIRNLIANGTLRQMRGTAGLIAIGSVVETFGDEIKDRLAKFLGESFVKRQKAGRAAQRSKRTNKTMAR